jgi:transposase
MALDLSGSDTAVAGGTVQIVVPTAHPLIYLATVLNWHMLIELVSSDLKRTTPKGNWQVGRKLQVRIHLAVYLLQVLYNLTDRKVEYGVKDNAAYQLFCGLNIVSKWHVPDHTKVQNFRNRLSPETQRLIANELAKFAVAQGLADPSETDFDSTVQEANISYPADANLMTKLAGLGKKIVVFLGKEAQELLPKGLGVDMKSIKEIARKYFFMPKKTTIEKKREVFANLLRIVKKQMHPVVKFCEKLSTKKISGLPWNIRRAIEQIKADAWRYLLDVGHFTRTNTMKKGKILSLFAKAVAYVDKKKVGKSAQFGRVFQLGRIKGNFLFMLKSTSVLMNDKLSLRPLLEEHQKLFGKGALRSIATDKGYWSGKNKKAINETTGIQENGLQHPVNIKNKQGLASQEIQEQLRNRRAGIEPLIGHVKQGGQLGRSRMKSDTTTLAAGYASVLGFNMRQIIRKQGQSMKKAA